METPSPHWVETLTGLGATGVELMVAYVGQHPMQGHPLAPLVQVSAEEAAQQRHAADLDLVLSGQPEGWAGQILSLLVKVISRQYTPKPYKYGNIDFQITRGLLGVSL
jgi:altronate dehydratase